MKIYLDNNATTQLDPQVCDAIIQELNSSFGNPSSVHSFGQEVRNRLIRARRTIAAYLDVSPQELIFTSGGTEAIQSILHNVRGHVVTSNVEHAAVFSALQHAEKKGVSVTYLEAGTNGAVTAEAVSKAICTNTSLIALMAVNNETGVKTDIASIAAIAEGKKIPFFVDGVSLLGKETFTIPAGVSAMAFSSHKLHGPSGIGALYLKSNQQFLPLIIGGGQEQGRRGGTENILGIIGFAKAIELLEKELPLASVKMRNLRDLLEKQLQERISGVLVNGSGERICNTTNLSFLGVDGESLLLNLDLAGVAVSHGSACSSGSLEPSRILFNMGIPKDVASASIRFSLSRFTTQEEIERCVDIVVDTVQKLRAITGKR